MWTDRNARSGWPRRVDERRDVVEAELDAELFEAEEIVESRRQATSGSVQTAPTACRGRGIGSGGRRMAAGAAAPRP